jgi:hypothetical protein
MQSIDHMPLAGTSIREVVKQSIIIAYKEDATKLENYLNSRGLNASTYKPDYTNEEQGYSASTRCFLSHHAAWKLASVNTSYTLICEADFVPCVDLDLLPVFWPLDNPLAWGYLYQGSPRLLALVRAGRYLRGHCAPTVAYVINGRVAEILLRFFDHQMNAYDPFSYFTWEAHLQWWVMGRGAEAYFPMKHYGEHGGLPNPEHSKYRAASRGGKHRADNLAAPLAFLPAYGANGRISYATGRLQARALGWCRLFSGRWIIDTNVYSRNWRDTVEMYMIGIRRLLF